MKKETKIISPSEKTSSSYVLVIGDVCIDAAAQTEESLKEGKMTFGKVIMKLGGVGRNISLNLRKLNVPVVFLTAVGADPFGKETVREAEKTGMDLSHSLFLESEPTPVILKTADKEGVQGGILALNTLKHLSPEYLKEKSRLIEEAAVCVLSGNLSKETLNHLGKNHKETPMFFDPASEKMTREKKELINAFHTVNPNQQEAEILSGSKIKSEEDAREAVEKIQKNGVKQVVLTMDDGGAVCHDGEEAFSVSSKEIEPVSTRGAGDAFQAALVYCFYHKRNLADSVHFAVAASALNLQTEEAVHPELSVKKIQEIMAELQKK